MAFNTGGALAGAASGAALGNFIPGIGTAIGAIGGAAAGGFSRGGGRGGKRKKQPLDFTTIPAPVYNGRMPYASPIDQTTYSDLGKQYAGQISERSQGKGMVGFDPAYSEKVKQNINADMDYQKGLDLDKISGQASGQGFRGGIPISLSERYLTNQQRNRQNSLNNVDIADLQARREDINSATYAQPELLNSSAAIQQNASQFDLAKNQFEQPLYVYNNEAQGPSALETGFSGAGSLLGTNQMKKTLAQALAARGTTDTGIPDSTAFTNALKTTLNYRQPY